MTSIRYSAPWHRESYDRLVNERLPEIIGSRLPLESYSVEQGGGRTCTAALAIGGRAGAARLLITGVPQPDEKGVFDVEGRPMVVVPLASCEELDKAEVKCVGEQLCDFIEERLGEAPPDLRWTDEVARAWLPIAEWVREFLTSGGPAGTAQVLDGQNWLARHEHLRRIVIPDRDRVIAPGQMGRVCPFCTPEGANIGKVLSVAVGARVREGKIIVEDASPAGALGVTASMVPLIGHDDANRALMGVNMMRQHVRADGAEPALVQTGNEPDAPDFWTGVNLLTAYVSWGSDTFEDAILISESCAARLCVGGLVEPGDKVSNRHGQKGVIGRIVPDAEMPHLADGTPVELVCSFIGLQARMNLGQLREAVLGRIARAEGAPVLAPAFGGPTDQEVRARLAAAGLPESGMEKLCMGKGGPQLPRPSTVGWVYWGITCHLARTKLSVASQDHGMRQGYPEYLALRNLGAYELITETFNTRALSRAGADDLPAQLAKGPVEQSGPPSPALCELQRRLAAGNVRVRLERGQLRFSIAEPEGETLELAEPVQHPWVGELTIRKVGVVTDVPEFQAMREANERMRRALKQHSPEGLLRQLREEMLDASARFFDVLVRPEHMRPGGQVAFSGRAVIAPATDLRTDQLGLPDELAWALFGPLVTCETGDAAAVKARSARAAAKLDEIMVRSWVILNRAPTIEPANLLAFHPVRARERVIRLNPIACRPVNADFDGDQAAVFLPITEGGQCEAGEKLSVLGHLRRDPALLAQLVPGHEPVWGLAELSRSDGGIERIRAVAGVDVAAPEGFVTRDTLTAALREVLTRDGAEKALAVLEELVRLGFEVARRSGASMCPFKGESLPELVAPQRMELDACIACMDDMDDRLMSRTDYDSPEAGPQILAIKSGARGSPAQLRTALIGAVIADMERRLVYTPHGFLQGLTAEEAFTRVIGARRGLGEVARACAEIGQQTVSAGAPKGYDVLVRAMRSDRPGAVLARAALFGAADGLGDLDARLLVGLMR